MMETVIAYGTEKFTLQLPPEAECLKLPKVAQTISPDLFRKRLNAFLRVNPLDLSSPILVVADKTRLCGYPEYLPILIEFLEEHGLKRNRLRCIIAYGTHPRQSPEECIQGYGPVFHKLNWIHHDCQNTDFTELGKTGQGTPIRVRTDLLNASCVITMGAICHHYFAGYGGGRKLIFPGCGERQAIYTNHGLYLDTEHNQLAPLCQPGILEKNPLAEDLFEIEDGGRKADLAIHGILDGHGQLRDLLVGHSREDFLMACEHHGRNCESDAGPYDLVIASCGGYPKDINYIQSHKAIHNSSMFVKDGGTLLLYCSCSDGIGSTTFLPWFEERSFQKAFEKLSQRYEGNGGTALATMTKLQRIRIGLVSELDDSFFATTGFQRVTHQEVQQEIDELPQHRSLAVIPNASLLVRKAEPKEGPEAGN